MKKKNGFVISTTLYSIFGIMLLTVFYILYLLSNNKILANSSINNIKEELSENETEGTDEEYNDTSGANEPIIAEGMIPVTYNEEKDIWIKANINSGWYNYTKQKWANAVTVSKTNRNTYINAEVGTEIPMTDINTMWVWIPRFKYKIPSDIGSVNDVVSPPEIDVIFESGTSSTGVSEEVYRSGITEDGTNTNYYTHPAFKDGSKVYNSTAYDIGGWKEELEGFWVGKFEIGSNTKDSSRIIIKPGEIALYNNNVSKLFQYSIGFAGGTIDSVGNVTFNGNDTYGLTSSTDTHMIKSTEWGAVAILSQSKYGKTGNSNFTGKNKEIYKNDSKEKYTGKSGKLSFHSTNYGMYLYNNKNDGTGASTTGTIYGVYDMSGCAWDSVMGNFNNISGFNSDAENNSGFNGILTANNTNKTDGISFPTRNYYDKYTENYSKSLKDAVILGDAIYELSNWYSDGRAVTPTKDSPWLIRGGDYGLNEYPIMFKSNPYDGGSYSSNVSTRAILIP